jgi:exosortase/archaeosortase family protein
VSTPYRLPWFLALGLCGGLFAFVAYDQSFWWMSDPDYAFGFLAPVFSLYILRERWPDINRFLDAAQAPGALRVRGFRGFLLAAGAAALLGLGGVGVILGSLMRAGSAVALTALTTAITLSSIAAAFGLLFVCIPSPPVLLRQGFGGQASPFDKLRAPSLSRGGDPALTASVRLEQDSRLAVLGQFLFPICVWLLSARLVHSVELHVSLFLENKVVGFVSMVFNLAGANLIREGNVLLLPTGRIGVAEACSGIRSLTGCLFSGAFLGAVFFRRLTPKIFLLAASLLLAFLSNLARNLLLTIWAYRHGPSAIQGWVHDATGYGVLILATIGLLLTVGFMKWAGRIGIEFSGKKELQ